MQMICISKGFSLIELLIVIALTAVVAAISIPQFQTAAVNSALREAARGVVADLSGTRQRAVEGKRQRLSSHIQPRQQQLFTFQQQHGCNPLDEILRRLQKRRPHRQHKQSYSQLPESGNSDPGGNFGPAKRKSLHGYGYLQHQWQSVCPVQYAMNGGTTLIESVIAVLLVSIGMMALLSMQPSAWRMTARTDYLGRAAMTLSKQLTTQELAIMNPCNTVATGTVTQTLYASGQGTAQTGDITFTVQTVTSAVATNVWRVTVTVSWPPLNTVGIKESIVVTRQEPFRLGVHIMTKQKGFTIAEVLVSLGVGLVIITAIYAAVVAGQRATGNIERKVVAQQDVRSVLELMALEIQMASFNPSYTTGIWMNPADCITVATSPNQTNRGIQAATDTSITIESDVNENGGILNNGTNPNEIITYSYDSTNQYITRQTSCGGNMPFLGDLPASGRPRTVRVINTAAVPVFRYFNAQGTEITPAGLPAGIPNIARIDITLWVETEDPRYEFNDTETVGLFNECHSKKPCDTRALVSITDTLTIFTYATVRKDVIQG